MSTHYTQNYQLSQWVRSDEVLMEDFNADNAKIDGALAGKADAAAVTALSQRVDGKADVSSVNSLAQTVSGHTAALNKKGNCQIYFSRYTGDGAYTAGTPQTFHFPGKPLLVAIGAANSEQMFLAFQGLSWGYSFYNSGVTGLMISWSGTSMSISSTSAAFQFNAANRAYNIMALIAMDS